MVDMRLIWKEQLRFVDEICRDIVKHDASKEVLEHAAGYAELEGGIPFAGNNECEGQEYVRVSYGEAYAYIKLTKSNHGDCFVLDSEHSWTWINDEMGVNDEECLSYEKTAAVLDRMSLEEAYENCSYPDCYDEYEGNEKEYKLLYVPFGTELN